ncbi:MBOAT family O-acyltransferase [Roseburia intestinalis]
MLFSSMVFLWIFLPVVFCGYHLLKDQYKNIWLLVASLIFYSWGEPAYIFLMLFSIIVNYLLGIWMDRYTKKKIVLIVAIIFNLLVLGYFKYFSSMVGVLNGLIGKELIQVKTIILPLGISFYTFQIMSYIIDLYRGEIKVQKNIFRLALYITFFPQLVAGPIVKYHDVENQIAHRECTPEKIGYGIKRFIYGLGKKVIISNSIASVVDTIFTNSVDTISTLWVWIGVFLYTLQIYYDFSGYSDMAIGLGKMFGFDFMENFNYPYISKSIQEFWRRWHISLSTWFKEYVYIPLGGNRKGKVRTYFNLWIVFALTGIWHGATLNFLIWGLWHGLFMFIERLGVKKLLDKNPLKIINYIYTMFVVIVGWAMFRCDSWKQAYDTLHAMFKGGRVTNEMLWYNIASTRSLVIIVIAIILAGPLQKIFPKLESQFKGEQNFCLLEGILQFIILLIAIMFLVSGQYNPFIYFKF